MTRGPRTPRTEWREVLFPVDSNPWWEKGHPRSTYEKKSVERRSLKYKSRGLSRPGRGVVVFGLIIDGVVGFLRYSLYRCYRTVQPRGRMTLGVKGVVQV